MSSKAIGLICGKALVPGVAAQLECGWCNGMAGVERCASLSPSFK